MAALWRIELLGGLKAEFVGSDQPGAPQLYGDLHSRRASALLAFLAYFPRPHARAALAERLWPGHDPQLSRGHLRVVLSSLRHVLEPPGTSSGSVLVADRLAVRLKPQAATTDVAQFEAAIQAASLATGLAEQSDCLMQAVELYRGPLLPGSEEEWVLPEARRLEELYFSALRRLIARLEHGGDLEQALLYARRGIIMDALREDVQRDLMRLHAAGGQPALALRQYRELEHALQQQLGATPDVETRALLRHIQSSTRQQACESIPKPARSPRQPRPALGDATDLSEGASPIGAPVPVLGAASASGNGLGPMQWTRFFGREHEIALLLQLLHDGPPRLITLSGAGGSGKTRLALEVARLRRERDRDRNKDQESDSSLWFVPLASLASLAGAHLLAGAIADALRLPRAPGPPLEQVLAALKECPRPVLVLDNFEHLLPGGAGFVQELLARAPHLRLLITSQRALEIAGEHVLALPTLPLPTPDEARVPEMMRFASVQMFHDRARAVRPGFRITRHNAVAISQLCVRLDGLPLAIELCAARAHAFSPSKMLARLERRLDFLVEPSPASSYQHPTLRAALEWSHALLWPDLARFFAQLGVFRGGFTSQAAAQVASEPHAAHFLEQLRAASLVVRQDAPEDAPEDASHDAPEQARFRLLESVREFAWERLSAPEVLVLGRRHAEFYRRLAEGEHVEAMSARAQRRLASNARMKPERDNLRAALLWSLEHDGELALHLVHLASPQWGDDMGESGRLALLALERAPQAPPGLISAVLGIAAMGAQHRGDYEQQHTLSQRRLALMRAHGNDLDAAWALFNLGCAQEGLADFEAATKYFQQALHVFRAWQHHGPQALQNVAWTLNRLGVCASGGGDLDEAQAHFAACLQVFRRAGDLDGVASTLSQQGDVARSRGDLPAARLLLDQSDQVQQQIGDVRAHPWRRYIWARLEWAESNLRAARASFEHALRDFAESGALDGTLLSLGALGCLAAEAGDWARALLLLGCEAAQRKQRACPLPPDCRPTREHALQQARALGQGASDAAYARGLASTLQAAVAIALSR